MSCAAASFEPPCERDLSASSSSAANCREEPPDEEEDRLSTAAPSICEEQETTTCWADIGGGRWADLLDSDDEDDEDLKNVPPVQCKTGKKRWADLVDELEGTVSTQSPAETVEHESEAETGGPGRIPDAEDNSPSWKTKGRTKNAWTSSSSWGDYDATASSSQDRSWGSTQWRPRHETKSSYEGYRSSWQDWNSWYERPSKGKGKGKSKGKGSGKSSSMASKCQCQFIVGIEEESRFRVCRRLLGPQGQHMKDIAQQTGAKLRLRGRGSKFLEGPEQQESSDPLMLCVSAPDQWSYDETKRLISSLLEDIYAQYRDFQQSEGCKPPKLRLNLHEGPRPGSF